MQALKPVPEVLQPPPPPVMESPRQEVSAPSSIKERLCFLIAEMNISVQPLAIRVKMFRQSPSLSFDPFISTKEATNVMCLGELSQSHTFSFSITSAQTRSPFSSWICSLTSFICLTAMNLASRLRSSARTSRMFCETRPFIALTFTLKCSWLSKSNSLLI